MSTWYEILTRRKHISTSKSVQDDFTSSSSQLARVLSTFDLTALGVGSTLGVGVYVLAGHVAKDTAGPAVILSFLIAAVASVFAGLCYAEFGARVPRAGSAYIYSYVCMGEFVAFIIGWNLILEYVIGSASVAKGLSIYLDTLLNNTLKETFTEIAPIRSSFLAEYFDFFSFSITILLGVSLAFGLKESSTINNIFSLINILVVIFVIIAGGINADTKNWTIKKDDIPLGISGGSGGFLPFGISGVIKGAATCFYGFVGFDCIATTGEEVKNPQRAIPIAIILSLFVVFLSYFGTSAVVTLMLPYYLQDPDAPIPHAFDVLHWNWAKWIVSIGGIFGLCASLFGAMFPLPRIIYAMANDALVFRFLGRVNSRFRTPVIGTLFAALLTGLMSALFNLKQLINMMSIGTLLAYTIVAACVIILRYSCKDEEKVEWTYSLLKPGTESDDEYSEDEKIYEKECQENLNLIPPKHQFTIKTIAKQMFNFSQKNPTQFTQQLVTLLVFIFGLLCLILGFLISYLQNEFVDGGLEAVIPISTVVVLMLVVLLAITAQPTDKTKLSFKVPLVPLIPALSICINLYLIMMLDNNTWIRFGIWMAIGIPIYLTSCNLYKTTNNTKNTLSNGHINQNYTPDQNEFINGLMLTIPKIVVQPPSPKQSTVEEITQPETNQMSFIQQRRSSIDSNDFTNAVLEIDRVLDENYFLDNLEAINPGNNFVVTENLDEDCISSVESLSSDTNTVCSSNSGSIHSKEHHIEAQIHNEDPDVDNDPRDEDLLEKMNDQIDKLVDSTEIFDIPKPPPFPKSDTEDLMEPNFPKSLITVSSIKNVKLKPVSKPEKQINDSPTKSLKKFDQIKSKLNLIFKDYHIVPIQDNRSYMEDKSSSLPVDKEVRREDVEEEIPSDFGKTKEFKDNLNKLLMRKHSNRTKTLEKPVNDATNLRTDEIKHRKMMANSLNSIRLRKTGQIDILENHQTNGEGSTVDEDKEEHKKLMNATLGSIKSRIRTSLIDKLDETKDNDNFNQGSRKQTSDKDKEDHKRRMIATLRSIKLRRTGLTLSDESDKIKNTFLS